jgi:hypothetical protein
MAVLAATNSRTLTDPESSFYREGRKEERKKGNTP